LVKSLENKHGIFSIKNVWWFNAQHYERTVLILNASGQAAPLLFQLAEIRV